jgi:hypothetical protein
LQQATPPVSLDRYLPWVHHPARVGRRPAGPHLANFDPKSKEWSFPSLSGDRRSVQQVA